MSISLDVCFGGGSPCSTSLFKCVTLCPSPLFDWVPGFSSGIVAGEAGKALAAGEPSLPSGLSGELLFSKSEDVVDVRDLQY